RVPAGVLGDRPAPPEVAVPGGRAGPLPARNRGAARAVPGGSRPALRCGRGQAVARGTGCRGGGAGCRPRAPRRAGAPDGAGAGGPPRDRGAPSRVSLHGREGETGRSREGAEDRGRCRRSSAGARGCRSPGGDPTASAPGLPGAPLLPLPGPDASTATPTRVAVAQAVPPVGRWRRRLPRLHRTAGDVRAGGGRRSD